jgi:flagellar protein FliS
MSTDPRFAYRETAARAASPVGRVILLYEQAIQDLGGALSAMAAQDVEQRTRQLSHALIVVGQLQACLDLDRGGEVARNLDRFYDVVRSRILEAQISSSAAILREQMDLLLSVRSAWIEVEQQERDGATPPAVPKPASALPSEPPAHPGKPQRWRA